MKIERFKIDIIARLSLGVILLGGLWACEKETLPEITVNRMEVTNSGETNTILLIEGGQQAVEVKTLPENAVDAEEYTYRYTSGNESVFTVDEQGNVTAVGIGEAALTVWSVNNTDLWTTCLVKVEKRIFPVTSIAIPENYQTYYMGVDKKLDLGGQVTVLPENATTPDVVYSTSDGMIAEVNEYGEVYTKALGDVTITVKAVDGSEIFTECKIKVRDVDYSNLLTGRENWSVTLSHEHFLDAVIDGSAPCLIDDSDDTCLAMVKPGKSIGGITVGATESVFFVVDMQAAAEFDFFVLRHRTYNNTTANLRVSKASAYGSNDGTTFVELVKGATLPTAASISSVIVDLPEMANYRYVKVTVDGWSSSGNTVQMSDFKLGKKKYNEAVPE